MPCKSDEILSAGIGLLFSVLPVHNQNAPLPGNSTLSDLRPKIKTCRLTKMLPIIYNIVEALKEIFRLLLLRI